MADRGLEWYGDAFRRQVDAALDKKMHEVGVVGVQYAQYLAPVRTGELRAGIRYEYDATTKTLSLISSSGHGIFVEFGTYKMPARPHIRPALERMAAVLGGSAGALGSNLAMNFNNAIPIKRPEILAHPRNARHAAIMRENRRTSRMYNYGGAGHAKQFITHRR